MSSNYLEALERWDTGAVQLLVAQGLFSSWLWLWVAILLTIEASIVTPAFVPPADFELMLARPLEHAATFVTLAFSFGVLLLELADHARVYGEYTRNPALTNDFQRPDVGWLAGSWAAELVDATAAVATPVGNPMYPTTNPTGALALT